MIDKNGEFDVLLAYAHNGSVANVFMDSVLAAFAEDARRTRRRLIEYHPVGGPYIHDNRSRAARYFLRNTDKQWLWFLDNDMDFPLDSLYRLLSAAEEHDCKILGAAYWNTYPGTQTLLSWLLMDPSRGVLALPRVPEETEPVQLTACGMGCTLIHRDALQAVADDYPNDPWDTFAADMLVRFTDGSMMVARSPDDFDIGDRVLVDEPVRMGEDVTFCLRAEKAGFHTYGLPTLIVDHYKQHRVVHGIAETGAVPVNVLQ